MDTEVVAAEVIEEDDVRVERRRSTSGSRGSCQPKCLLADSIRRLDGQGPVVELDEYRGKLLVVTLGVSAVVERTGLTVSVWGSPDQLVWGDKPLISLRQRQYCGVYSALLNLAHRPETRYLRVEWNISRWGKGEGAAQFGFEVFAEESGARVSTSACA